MPDDRPMVDGIKFVLDGREVEAAPGETIWQVASRHGTEIPHLCYSPAPGYRPDGNCRACMVEIEGERVLAASCIRKPSPGMKVSTRLGAGESLAQAGLRAAGRRPAGARGRARSRTRASGTGPSASRSRRAASRRSSVPTRRTISATRPWRCSSTPASSATCASAPAARCRSTTSSAWPRAGTCEKIVFDFDDPMGASTCVACGECVQACPTGALMPATHGRRDGRLHQRARPRGRQRLPLLRRRLPAHLPDQGRPHRRGRTAATARRTRTGCASRAASASTTCIIPTG